MEAKGDMHGPRAACKQHAVAMKGGDAHDVERDREKESSSQKAYELPLVCQCIAEPGLLQSPLHAARPSISYKWSTAQGGQQVATTIHHPDTAETCSPQASPSFPLSDSKSPSDHECLKAIADRQRHLWFVVIVRRCAPDAGCDDYQSYGAHRSGAAAFLACVDEALSSERLAGDTAVLVGTHLEQKWEAVPKSLLDFESQAVWVGFDPLCQGGARGTDHGRAVGAHICCLPYLTSFRWPAPSIVLGLASEGQHARQMGQPKRRRIVRMSSLLPHGWAPPSLHKEAASQKLPPKSGPRKQAPREKYGLKRISQLGPRSPPPRRPRITRPPRPDPMEVQDS
eukprot:1157499-Pelagomonas_calceolata.AAC.5